MSKEEKQNRLCDAIESKEEDLKNDICKEMDYIRFCGEVKECSMMMKRIEKIVDVFECHFVIDPLSSTKYLELKYKKYHKHNNQLADN